MANEAQKRGSGGSVVMHCGCVHDGQDKIHGKGMRVHNRCDGNKAARCTVCKTVRTPSGAERVEK